MVFIFTGMIRVDAETVDAERLKDYLKDAVQIGLDTENIGEFDDGEVVCLEVNWETLHQVDDEVK